MDKEKQLPIDRGWAWVIVVAASSLFGLQSGGFKTQGILLVELTERYEGIYPISTLIWVLTGKYILSTLLGPLVGFLSVKFTHRTVSIVGVLLLAAGYIGLAYAPNFPAMILLYSIPAGIGEGIIYLCAVLVSGQYFKKRKALALGIIASGSGIGSMVLPHVYRLLFDNLDFSGACLLKAGFILQFLIPACLYRPLSYYLKQRRQEVGVIALMDGKSAEEDLASLNNRIEVRIRSVSVSYPKVELSEYAATFHSASHIPLSAPAPQLATSIGDISGSVVFTKTEQQVTKLGSSDEATDERFHWRVILMPKFLIVGLSICLYAFGTCVVFQGIPSLGKESGVPKKTVAIAMMVGGAVEIPCRILNGMLADRKLVSNAAQYASGLFLPGLMCLLCALISGLVGIALVLIGMSTVGMSVFSIIPVVLIELLGAQYVTSGMSTQLFCHGIAFIASSYITGAIYDASGSWRLVYFYIAAMMISASCVVWPYCLFRWYRKSCTSREDVDTDTS